MSTPQLTKTLSLDAGSNGPERKLSGGPTPPAHHYVPFIPKRESMAMRDRTTGVSDVFKDCKPVYPFIQPDGAQIMVTEYDFHVRMAKKYKALLGDKYIFPIYETTPRKLEDCQLFDITKADKCFHDIFIPHEIEIAVTGGIDTIKVDAMKNFFIIAKRGENPIIAAGLKVILSKEIKEFEDKRRALQGSGSFCGPSNNASTTSDEVIEQFIAGMEVPNVRRIKDLLGFVEDPEETLEKMRALGLLEKYMYKVDDNEYFDKFVNNKSKIQDFGADYRNFRDDEEFDFSEFEQKVVVSGAEDSDKPCDTSFESEIDIEPHKMGPPKTMLSAHSCDSGLDLESPPLSPISAINSPSPSA